MGCGEEFSNAFLDEDADFLHAIPLSRELRVTAPAAHVWESGFGLSTSIQALVADKQSELYLHTRELSLGVDNGVLHQLRAIQRLVEGPPAQRSPGHRIWGPFRDPLDPMVSRFVMSRDQDGAFTYALEQGPARSDGDETETETFTAVISGYFEPARQGLHAGSGTITFDLDAMDRLGSNQSRGLVQVDYDLRQGRLSMDLTLHGFGSDPGTPPTDLVVSYQRTAEGAGDLEWATWDEQRRLIEVRSRWNPEGAGRSDLRITPLGHGQVVLISECWDSGFTLVYSLVTAPPGVPRAEGDPKRCAFEDRLLPERIEAPRPPE